MYSGRYARSRPYASMLMITDQYLALFWFEYGQIKKQNKTKEKKKQTNRQKKKNDSRLLPRLSLPLRQKLITPMIGKSAVKFIRFRNW